MSGSAAVALGSGTATRTISQPASASFRIWESVATGSRVSAVAMDWTTIGLSPPILTPPTSSTLVGRRGARSVIGNSSVAVSGRTTLGQQFGQEARAERGVDLRYIAF